jgi:hypothetical protein
MLYKERQIFKLKNTRKLKFHRKNFKWTEKKFNAIKMQQIVYKLGNWKAIKYTCRSKGKGKECQWKERLGEGKFGKERRDNGKEESNVKKKSRNGKKECRNKNCWGDQMKQKIQKNADKIRKKIKREFFKTYLYQDLFFTVLRLPSNKMDLSIFQFA